MENDSRLKRASPWLIAVLCIGFAAAPTPLAAQSQADQDGVGIETQQFEDWILRCRPASDIQPRTCRMVQQVVAQDGGKPVLQFLIGRFGPEKVLGAVIIVPIGVRLPPGLSIVVDDRPLHTYSFERCDPKTCEARALLEGELLKDLKAGLTAQVKFQNAASQLMAVSISLKGFSAAMRALP
ncbi:MAG: invasion associated locus B family protein [Alphaproteobacteria bacterium]